MFHNSWIEISKKNLIHNIKIHRKLIGKSVKLICVIKSNAYGHGLILIAKVLDKLKDVDILATVNLEEAIELRDSGVKKPILVLSYYGVTENRKKLIEQLNCSIEKNISLMVYDKKTVSLLNQLALKKNKKAKVHIKVETGMARVGVSYSEATQFIKYVKSLKNIKISGLASHFATTEESNQYFANFQLKNFKALIEDLEKKKIFIPIKHIAASAAITLSEQNHFDAVRLGISMYGLWPSKENKKVIRKKYPWFDLLPVLSWKTKLFQVKNLEADVPIGYGCAFRTTRPITMGLIPVGYFEGLDRKLSNLGYVLVGGKKCKIIGRVCMNIAMVDVSSVKNVKSGDEVVLIGRQGKNIALADDFADIQDTINYEIVSRLNPYILRVLK